jgi:cytochrome b561
VQPAPIYGTTAKLLHWLIAAILLGQLALGWLMPEVRRGMAPGTAMNLHMSIGVVALALIAVRLAWRAAHPVAPHTSLPGWQRASSEAVHWLLYALVLATTVTGWFYASMRGWTVTLFSLFALPALAQEGSQLGRAIGRLHESATALLAIVIGVHIAAALVHLLVYRDEVMRRMLPGRAAGR